MRVVLRVLFLWVISSGILLAAQILQPIVPLQLDGEAHPTQLPPLATLGSPQCDSAGDVYIRYTAAQTSGSATSSVARIEADGSTQTITLAPLPNASGESHALTFAADSSGAVHQILRASVDSDEHDTSSRVEYVRFDSDGDVRSYAPFPGEFIPSVFLPLPSGDFFATGVTLEQSDDGVSENSLAGIFGPDAKLQSRLRTDTSKSGSAGKEDDDPFVRAEMVRLGDDGNIYMLMASDRATVEVVNQAGRIIHKLQLQEPFETEVASDMWMSGNRLLVVYEGEADDPKDSYVYVLYDAQSGEIIRAYKPEFLGTIACFQDGQTITVLARQPESGTTSIGTAELQ